MRTMLRISFDFISAYDGEENIFFVLYFLQPATF